MARSGLGCGLALAVALSACASVRGAGSASPPAVRTADPPRHRIDLRPPGRFTDPLRVAKLWLAIPELHRIASQALADEGVPGMALALVIDDRIAWSAGFGVRDLDGRALVTANSVFGIGSITKPITAMAVLRLRDAGKIDLDAPAATYLPELAGVAVPGRGLAGPTIRELMTHTSGLPRLGDFSYSTPPHEPSEAELLRSLSGYALWHEPGEHMYSNLGYQVLGIIVERVAAEPLREHTMRRILAPLGIEHAWWDHADVPTHLRTAPHAVERGELVVKPAWRHGAAAGAGALLFDIEGLAALARFQLAAYAEPDELDDGPLAYASVRESHVAVLHDLSAEAGEHGLSARALGYGLGWSVQRECSGERVVSHNGGTEGYASSIMMLPDHGVALVLLSNLNDWSREATMRKLLGALRNTGGLVAREPVAAPELLLAADRWARLLAAWDESAFREAWSPHDHAEDRIDRHRRTFVAIATMVGRCAGPELDETLRPFVGDFVLACERADVRVRVAATPASGGKVLSAQVTLVGVSPPAELRRSAEATLALFASWDDAKFTALFAPVFPIASNRRGFREYGRRWGECELGDVTEVRPDGATWRAHCQRAEVDLKLQSDRDDHRITFIDANVDAPERRRCK